MKQAVCILIPVSYLLADDCYLCVSRKNNETQFRLPGGKVDAG
jgi:hypothetical protein